MQTKVLIANGGDSHQIEMARVLAKTKYPSFPRLGCAAYLSCLFKNSGITIDFILEAGRLAHVLERVRGWQVIQVGSQQPGDVGVAFDDDKSIAGADHVYLVVGLIDKDWMMITDNQNTVVHKRAASGGGKKTPTEYFLRAT